MLLGRSPCIKHMIFQHHHQEVYVGAKTHSGQYSVLFRNAVKMQVNLSFTAKLKLNARRLK